MARLFNRNFIVGVTGSIAAYKAAELVRSLIREGANVRVIMTEVCASHDWGLTTGCIPTAVSTGVPSVLQV